MKTKTSSTKTHPSRKNPDAARARKLALKVARQSRPKQRWIPELKTWIR